jgi:hypothetical protein
MQALLFILEECFLEEKVLPVPIIGQFEVELDLQHVFVIEDILFGFAQGRVAK